MSNPHSAVSPTLTVATQVLTIAHLGTDGIPIVNEVLGVVSHIAQLAQKIYTQRESLRELVRKARELASTIARVVGDRTPPNHLAPTLKRTLNTLNEVEAFMEAHIKKSRWKRLVAHLFSISDELERFKQDIADVLEELNMVTAIDTNLRVVNTEALLDDNMPWDGPIRRLHDGLVEKGELLFTQSLFANSPIVKFHSAVVKITEGSEAKAMVMRYIDQPTVSQRNLKGVAFRYMREYDEIMKHLSKAAVSHPYIAIIYGRTSGSPLERTTVLKLDPVIIPAARWILTHNDIDTSVCIALKLMDAAAHLCRHGIDWVPQARGACVDHHGEPIIGFDMDLQKSVAERMVAVYQTQMDSIIILCNNPPSSEVSGQVKELRYSLASRPRGMSPLAATVVQTLRTTVAFCKNARKIVVSIPRSDLVTYLDIPNLRLNGSDDYLANMASVLDRRTWYYLFTWARMLYFLARRSNGGEYRAEYCTSDTGDHLVVIWLHAISTNVWVNIYSVEIPDERRDQARAAFNIASRVVDPVLPSVRLFWWAQVTPSGSACRTLIFA